MNDQSTPLRDPTVTHEPTPATHLDHDEEKSGHGQAQVQHTLEPRHAQAKWSHMLRTIGRGLVAVVVLAAGVFAAFWFNWTEGKAQTGASEQQGARLIETFTAKPQTTSVTIRSMGTVMPAREVVIQPRVSGKIVEQNASFVPGGQFQAGQMMVRIDRTDYQYAVRQARSDLETAQANLEIEQGDQAVAREELELLQGDIANIDRSLILREPQGRQARAAVGSAQAAVDQAELDLSRTKIEAPFDGQIISRSVAAGNNVSQGTQLATFVGLERYWIEITVPTRQLRWIDIPRKPSQSGSQARITNQSAWGRDAFRQGHVTQLIGSLEAQTRLARLTVRVDDPLALGPDHIDKPALVLGAFVDVKVRGRSLEDVIVMDRNYLRENQTVWVMNDSNELETKSVTVAFRGRDRVYITDGLDNGDRIVTTNLSSPVEGMRLRTVDSDDE